MNLIGVMPNPNWLPLTLVWGSREAKCSLASLVFNATGGNNVIPFWTKQHEIDGLHIQRQRGAVSPAQMLSPVRYIQTELKENYATQRDER